MSTLRYTLSTDPSRKFTTIEEAAAAGVECPLGTRIVNNRGRLQAILIEVDGNRGWLNFDITRNMYSKASLARKTIRGLSNAEVCGMRLCMWFQPRHSWYLPIWDKVNAAQLALLCGVSKDTAWEWLEGKSVPAMEHREKIRDHTPPGDGFPLWLWERPDCETRITKEVQP